MHIAAAAAAIFSGFITLPWCIEYLMSTAAMGFCSGDCGSGYSTLGALNILCPLRQQGSAAATAAVVAAAVAALIMLWRSGLCVKAGAMHLRVCHSRLSLILASLVGGIRLRSALCVICKRARYCRKYRLSPLVCHKALAARDL
jgi:hypothetical protein